MHILILAGGGGIRLWPLSRNDFPKQFLHFGDGQTLLQKTVLRFLHSPYVKTIFIATNKEQEHLVKRQLEGIDTKGKIKIIIEPCRKNTAPAIALSLKFLEKEKIDKNEPLLILPSDHLIEPQTVFSDYLEEIRPLIKDHLILFGISPTRPETGYGYIQIGEKFDRLTHEVKRFIEKPDIQTAKTYLATHNYYWNSGIVAGTIAQFLSHINEYAPEIETTGTFDDILSRFDKMPEISFDYAVLEKSTTILVCPLPVTWSDVGCWDSVYDVMSKDDNQNVKHGNVLSVNTKNSLIIGGKRLISTIGVEDLLIIETESTTFISKKGESQKIKEMIHEIPKNQVLSQQKSNPYSIHKMEVASGQNGKISTTSHGKIVVLQGTAFLSGQSFETSETIVFSKNEDLVIENKNPHLLELLLITFEGSSFL